MAYKQNIEGKNPKKHVLNDKQRIKNNDGLKVQSEQLYVRTEGVVYIRTDNNIFESNAFHQRNSTLKDN